MLKKTSSIVLGVIVISMFLCNGTFAKAEECPQTHIFVNYGLMTLHDEWCSKTDPDTLSPIREKLKLQEQAIYNTLAPYQQSAYNYTKDKLKIGGEEGRLASLVSIQVYVAQPGVTFEDIQTYYEGKVTEGTLYLEDLVKVADSRNIKERREKLRLAFAKISSLFPTEEDRNKLMDYIDHGDLKGFIGTSIESGFNPPEGQSNISIQPIYVDPETYEVRNDKPVWVIISTYSRVFERPPLLRTPTQTP